MLGFLQEKCQSLKVELDLRQDLQPYHWAYYTFYNGGPKRWHVMRTYLEMRQNQQLIPPELQEAVDTIKRRNMAAQRIGNKNEYLKDLVFDMPKARSSKMMGSLITDCSTSRPTSNLENSCAGSLPTSLWQKSWGINAGGWACVFSASPLKHLC